MGDKLTSLRFKKNPFHERIQIENIKRKDGTDYSVRENRDRYFFPDEWAVFFDNLNSLNQKVTFRFLINTGARINEIRHVKVGDVDFDRQNIVFRWTKSRNKDGSRRIRTIPISSEFKRYLNKLIKLKKLKMEDTFPVLTTSSANVAMTKALKKAKIPDWKMFSVHNVRKTTEMYLLALDIDTSKVEKHMGHTLAIAMKYYVSPDIFNFEDRDKMRQIIGDLYRR